MPLGDLIGEVAHRVVISILETLIEIPVRALGYVIVKYVFYFGRRDVDWDGLAVAIAGILGWCALAIAVYKIWF
jgi:hypothetical protein